MFTDKAPGYDVSEKESIQDEMEYLKTPVIWWYISNLPQKMMFSAPSQILMPL